MKIDTPWSTEAIDILPISPKAKFLLWLWLMMDRSMWFAIGAIAGGAAVYFVR